MLSWILPLVASLAVAAITLMARWVMLVPHRKVQTWLPWMQATTAGLLLGDSLLHMLPEAISHGLAMDFACLVLALGMLLLVCVETGVRVLAAKSGIAAFARMDILGDALHHLIDGVVIGAAFEVNPALGMIMATTILLHELPRSIGHAGVLVAGGYAPRAAFRISVLAAVAVPIGAIGTTLLSVLPGFIGMGLAFAAGCTIYLACVDVLPAVWQRLDARSRLAPMTGMTGGMMFMWLAAVIDHLH